MNEVSHYSAFQNPNEPISNSNDFLDFLTGENFSTWFRNKEIRDNIRNGQQYFNELREPNSPSRHSPSSLLKCHRKQFYKQHNSPKETADPKGIFWYGTAFEEQIVIPFLESVVREIGGYVRKSDWVDFSVETDAANLQFKGKTDPLIVDSDGIPIVPIEVKSRTSIESLDSPSRQHRAQIHAYIVGLAEKYQIEPPTGVILYGSRKTLDVKCFNVPFSQNFWNGVVVEWAAEQTKFQIEETLPPADPEQSWECGYCPYRERCGKGSSPVTDSGVDGLVPGFTDYPREKVRKYLEYASDEVLTSALASEFPSLASDFPVKKWACNRCNTTVEWKEIESATNPLCPNCAEDDVLSPLRSPNTISAGGKYE